MAIPMAPTGTFKVRMRAALAQHFYERGLAWIAYQRGGHNGRWPPRKVGDCVGWGCVKMLADIHDMPANVVALGLVDFIARNERGQEPV